jgi:hypothetical protein
MFDTRAQAENDLVRALTELSRSRASVGTSPEATFARNLAASRAQSAGQFGDDFLEQQRSALRTQSQLGLQTAEQGLAEGFGRRGLAGTMPMSAIAGLRQQSGTDLQRTLADFEMQAAQSREEAQRNSLADLFGVSSQEEQRRLDIDKQIADALLSVEREVPDLSVLLGEFSGLDSVLGGGTIPGAMAPSLMPQQGQTFEDVLRAQGVIGSRTSGWPVFGPVRASPGYSNSGRPLG